MFVRYFLGYMVVGALALFYLWLGWFAWTVSFHELTHPLRDSGWLTPVFKDDKSRAQEVLAGVLVWASAILLMVYAADRRGWRRVVIALWPLVIFIAVFLPAAQFAVIAAVGGVIALIASSAPAKTPEPDARPAADAKPRPASKSDAGKKQSAPSGVSGANVSP